METMDSMNSMDSVDDGFTRWNSSLFDGDTGRTSFNPNRFRMNNDNMDTTTAPILLGVGGGLLVLSLLLLIARLWSRLRPVLRLHADDWTVLAATVISTTSHISYILFSRWNCK